MARVLIVTNDSALRSHVADDVHFLGPDNLLDTIDATCTVIVDLEPLRGIELLRACRERCSEATRILATTYDDLPDVVRLGDRSLFHRVVPRARLGTILERATPSPQHADDFDLLGLTDLLAHSAELIVRTKGVIVRRLDPDSGLAVELVVPASEVDALKKDLAALWPEPTPNGDHPVAQMLGGLEKHHELRVRVVEEDPDAFAYVVLLPWHERSKVTIVLGVHRKEERATLRKIVAELHRHVIDDVAEYPLPMLPSRSWATSPPTAIDEYDWVATEAYVGPDRRVQATPFLGPRTLGGRRRSLLRRANAFADGLSPRTKRLFSAYILLAATDALLTWRFAGRAGISEANPIVARLVERGPWAFFLLKNMLTLGGFFALARLEHFRVGRALMTFALLFYLALDIYWFVVVL